MVLQKTTVSELKLKSKPRATKPKGPTHKQLVKAIIDYLELHGLEVSETDAGKTYRLKGQYQDPVTGKIRNEWENTSKRHGRVKIGWADITAGIPRIVIIKGIEQVVSQSCAIEVKAGKDVLRPEQKQRLARMEAQGWIVIVARSVGQVIEIIGPYIHEYRVWCFEQARKARKKEAGIIVESQLLSQPKQ